MARRGPGLRARAGRRRLRRCSPAGPAATCRCGPTSRPRTPAPSSSTCTAAAGSWATSTPTTRSAAGSRTPPARRSCPSTTASPRSTRTRRRSTTRRSCCAHLGPSRRRPGRAGRRQCRAPASPPGSRCGHRDAGLPLAGQLLFYPATDPTSSHPSITANGSGYFLTADRHGVLLGAVPARRRGRDRPGDRAARRRRRRCRPGRRRHRGVRPAARRGPGLRRASGAGGRPGPPRSRAPA